MNIHIIRDREVDEVLYADVLAILRSSPGTMNFIAGEDVAILERRLFELELDELERMKEPFKDLTENEQNPLPKSVFEDRCNYEYSAKINESIQLWKIVFTWEDLFKICEDYRNRNNLPKADFVILLTGYSNELNWFGAAEEHANNFFIQTTQWSSYLDSNVDSALPLSYESVVWVLRKLMFDSWSEGWEFLHETPIGCMNDFCRNKQEISLKIRTGDVCRACLSLLQQRDVNPNILRQAFHIMDRVRNGLTWKQMAEFIKQPGRLELRGPMRKLHLLDAGGIEVRLNPLERALYLLILDYSEGINLNNLDAESEKLLSYYTRFATQGDEAAHRRTVDSLCNLQENARNITLSRIKRKFIETVGEDLAHHYFPQNIGEGVYRIQLDREFVVGD